MLAMLPVYTAVCHATSMACHDIGSIEQHYRVLDPSPLVTVLGGKLH
jgi:hypothetical protein